MYFSLFTLLLFSLSLGGNAQLQAEYSSSVLPTVLTGVASYYDGGDRIYLMGGFLSGDGYRDEVFLYTISSDTLELAGYLPGVVAFGSVHPSNDGKHLFYFGGGSYYRDVYKYDLEGNSAEKVATLPDYLQYSSTEDYNSTHILILGGNGRRNGMLLFSTVDYTSKDVGSLQRIYYDLGSVRIGDKVYITGDAVDVEAKEPAEVLDLLTLESTLHESVLPNITNRLISNIIWDGRWIYLMGGWQADSEKTDGILQLNPDTLSYQFLSVEGYPVEGNRYWYHAPSSVFVPSLNRIYCFGGLIYPGSVFQDKLFWIDLDPLHPSTTSPPIETTTFNPDLFTCDNRTDGFYPHPTDCSMFITCLGGTTGIHKCPSPLLFNPDKGTCDAPSQVDCSLTCVDRPDGLYTHPHDCGLFILCEMEMLQVYRCPPPFLFDPLLIRCNFPEQVQCET